MPPDEMHELKTEVAVIRRDVQEVKEFFPQITLVLQEMAVANERLSSNIEEHKAIWVQIETQRSKQEGLALAIQEIKTSQDECLKRQAKDETSEEATARENRAFWRDLLKSGILVVAGALVTMILLHGKEILGREDDPSPKITQGAKK